MKRSQPIIAIDGPVGVGKSAVAAQLARRLGFIYIDTGAMYRAVALKALRAGLCLDDADAVAALARETHLHFERKEGELRMICDGMDVSEAIRLPEVSAATSPVADNPAVRERLVALQREMGENGGVVMEGRDISTVVFPDAELKIYLDARPDIRARRRCDQLIAKGKSITYEKTLEDLNERDRRDRMRPVGALKKADDAVIVDTSDLTEDQVIEELRRLAWEKGARE